MDRVWALYKKELRTYFNSPIAYIVLTVLLIGVGYFFFQTFFAGEQANLRVFFRVAAWSFLLFGPAVTMKLLAEEKKAGTIEGLFTLPLREWEMVLGKFVAGWTLLAVYLLITLVYPISISFLGNLDGGPVVGGYLGLFFLGGTFVALGMFASSISRNQVISLIVAFVIALLLFMLDMLLPFVPTAAQNVIEFVGVDAHFKNISRGVLDTRDAIYSLSLMAFFLFLAVQALKTRLSDRSRAWRLNRWLYIGAAVGSLLALNALSFVAHARIDLTEDQQFTLSDGSVELVTGLEDQLTITAYFSKDIPAPANNHAAVVRDLLEEYRAASDGRVVYRFTDPDAGADDQPDPELTAQAQAAGVPKIDMRTFGKDQMQIVKVYMGLALQYGEQTEALPIIQNLPDLEYDITTRIAKLVRDKAPTVGFLGGHGELTLAQGLTKVAGVLGDKFTVKDIDLSQGDAGLADVDVLVVAGPKQEIPGAQLFAIDQFVMGGGKAAFFVARNTVDTRSLIGQPVATGLEDVLASYGVSVQSDLVLDQQSERIAMQRAQGNMRFQSIVQFPAFVKVTDLAQDTSLTKNLTGLVMPFASPLAVDAPAGVKAQTIARSSQATWLFAVEDSFLADPQALPQADPENLAGPQNLVVTLTGSFPSHFKSAQKPVGATDTPIIESPETRVVVVGSNDWISDAMPNRLNVAFFANLLDWLVQDEGLMAIRTRSINNRPLKQLGDTGRATFKYANMLLPPLFLVAFGIVRWRLRTRRKRRALANIEATRREE